MLLFSLFLIAFIFYEFYISKYGLEVTEYTIKEEKLDNSIRIVQLTDLHDSLFGENNEKLVQLVEEAEPDLIFITGDLVNSKTGEDTSIATDLIKDLEEIAPVYFSYGNQEKDLEKDYGIDITSLYTEAGALVLDKDWVDVEVNGQAVRIGGIYGYCLPDIYAQESGRSEESDFLKSFQDTDRLKLLLCHMPYSWLVEGSLYDWNVDLVYSGHVHGGQIRIPFIGGLWAPDQGFFPGKECGTYTTTEENWKQMKTDILAFAKANGYDTSYTENQETYEKSMLVLSRGLGNTDSIPRFNNIPEILVTDLVPEE